ncbi:MAG TPA: hypothetical protein DCL44_09685 [Elusimicrobia bacterium]|nr:hypothetical protein [Elusimicrobiota bacterium]
MNDKKILLINPRVDYRPQPPLGLLYVAKRLEEKGYTVSLYDPVHGDNEAEFVSFFKEQNAFAVGITCLTAQENKLLYYAGLCKKLDPSVKVIAGGVHPTLIPERLISEPSVDVVVYGEGEETAPELFDAIRSGGSLSGVRGIGFKKDGVPVITPARELITDLDALSFPSRHLLNIKWYTKRLSLIRGQWVKATTLIATRGCPYQCIFCSSHKIFGRKVRFRSPANVVAEIKELRAAYGLEAVLFADDTLTIKKDWLIEMCAILKKECPGISWACQGRIETLDEEMLKAMVAAGCLQIEFGVESGSQKVLNALKKHQTVEQIRETFKLCKKLGIRDMANFIIGSPGETQEDIEQTRMLAREIDADCTEFFILTPYPGTELHDMATQNNWLIPGEAFYGRESKKPIMSINFKPEELVEMRKKLWEENLKNIWQDYLLDARFLLDVALFTLKNPVYILRYLRVLAREKSLAELGRYINEEYSRMG